MSKQTLEEAIDNAVITERVLFASEASYKHCCDAVILKRGPQNLFSLLKNPVVIMATEENPLEADVTGSVVDVCIVAFAVAVAYHPNVGSLSIEAVNNYLRNQYGFSFKSVLGEVRPTLDVTSEHIERILGKDKAKVFTPNMHTIEPIPAVVTEVFAFQEFDPFGEGAVKLAAKKFLEHVPVEYRDGAVYGSIEVTGKALDVCACIMVFMELSAALGVSKKNVLDKFKRDYQLDGQAILDRSYDLRRDSSAAQMRKDTAFKSLVDTVESGGEEVCHFPDGDSCTVGFDYAGQVGNITVTRIGDTTVIIRGPKLKVCALTIVFSDLAKVTPEHTHHLFERLESKYKVERTDITKEIRHIYATRQVPGVYRAKSPQDRLSLTDVFTRSRTSIDVERDDLVLRHFLHKAESDDPSLLEEMTVKHYDGLKDLFIQLRDKDVAFKEKELLLGHLKQYVTLPMLIMVMEQHFQSTDM